MKNMTAANIAKACAGELIWPEKMSAEHSRADYDTLEITGVVTDNRKVEKDNLFIPFVGEKVDAHRFIPQAFAAGAALVLSERRLDDPAGPYVLVQSSEQALKDIAAFYRKQLTIPVVGIIGSVGKTSTKEMVASVLSQKYDVLKTEANFNNEIGMPMTLLRIRERHEVAVIEMGIDSFGEMTRLATVARPDFVVMTNIGQAHLENLKTRDGILAAKTEVFNFLNPQGEAILNGDDDKLSTITKAGGADIVFYGLGRDASTDMKDTDPVETARLNAEIAGELMKALKRDGLQASPVDENGMVQQGLVSDALAGKVQELFTASNVQLLGNEGVQADFTTPAGTFTAIIPIPGEHNVYNALAAAAVGYRLGLNNDQIKAGMEQAATISGRVNFLHLAQNVTVIDDCYNANPASMRASLGVLASSEGRRIAVLGDMGELGEQERKMHYGVGASAAADRIDVLFTAGELSEEIARGAREHSNGRMQIYHFATREEMTKALLGDVRSGDTILVKASHFMEFPKVVEALKEYF